MFGEEYSPEQIISDLRGFGFRLYVDDAGAVHGKIARGVKITLEMRAVIDRLQGMNDQVAALLKAEAAEGNRREYVGISVQEACALGEKVKAGELELDGKVHYHRSTGLCDMTVIERRAQA